MALRGEPAHMPEKHADLRGQKRGGRLIENNQGGVGAQGFRDRHHRRFVWPQLADLHARIDLEADPREQQASARIGFAPIYEQPGASWKPLGQEQVLANRYLWHEIEVLMHHRDAERGGGVRRRQADFPAFNKDLPGIRLTRAADLPD